MTSIIQSVGNGAYSMLGYLGSGVYLGISAVGSGASRLTQATYSYFFPSQKPVVIEPTPLSRMDRIFTIKNFEWNFRNPFATVFKSGNNFIDEQYSLEVFRGVDKNFTLLSNSFKDVCNSLRNFEFANAIGHFINTLGLVVLGVIKCEVGNALKAAFGIGISSLKLVVHSLLTICYTFKGMFHLVCGSAEKKDKAYEAALRNLLYLGKDLLTIVACCMEAVPVTVILGSIVFLPAIGWLIALFRIICEACLLNNAGGNTDFQSLAFLPNWF